MDWAAIGPFLTGHEQKSHETVPLGEGIFVHQIVKTTLKSIQKRYPNVRASTWVYIRRFEICFAYIHTYIYIYTG